MCDAIRNIVRALVGIFCALVPIGLQAQLSIEDRNTVYLEIEAALISYHYLFSTGSPYEIANQAYGAPLVTISTDGTTTVMATPEEVESWVEGFLDSIRSQGWYRSAMPSPTICVLGQNSGFGSGQFIRYREDGSEISRSGMTYIFQRKPEGWRMTTFLAQESNVQLSC